MSTESDPQQAPSVRWRPGLRLRYAVMATALAALTFGVGGGVALSVYHDSLIANVQSAVNGTAHAVVDAARKGQLPNPIPMPVAPNVPRVQVLDAAGQVVSGDPASASAPPMRVLADRTKGRMTTVINPVNLPERQTAVIAERVTGPTGPLTIIAAGSLDPVNAKAAEARRLECSRWRHFACHCRSRRLGNRGKNPSARRATPCPGLIDHGKRGSGP